jgi:Big-like domain-containing protein
MRFARTKAFPRFLSVAACLMVLASMASPAAAQSNGWQGGPGAILDNTYAGFVDLPSNGATVPGSGSFVVGGWFVDQAAEGWAGADNMQVWLGTMDGGGHMIAQGTVAQNRPDVATALGNPFWAASGFSATVPGSAVPGGAQTLNVYLHTGGKGWWFKTVNVTGGGPAGTATAPAPGAPAAGTAPGDAPILKITAPNEGDNVQAKGSSDFTITGTATDPTFGAGAIDKVDVWILGEPDSGTQLGTVTPAGDGSWSLTFKPTKFPSTHVNIYVFAHSKATGKTTETIRGFNIVG